MTEVSAETTGEPTPTPTGAVCPNCGWDQSVTVSRIDIEAVTQETPEDGKVVFRVTRSGPTDQLCRVAARWTGTVSLTDFVEGTGQSGTLTWQIDGSEPRYIELTIKPDEMVEPDETVTVILSDPLNCVIGIGEATATILNDDVEAVPIPPAPDIDVGYDGNLPFGGLGIGTACLVGQPGNQRVVTKSSLMIEAERDGEIDRFQWNNRYDGHGRVGYSTGDGGIIAWTLQIVPNPGARPLKPGPVIGRTRKITAPIKRDAWAEEYAAAGGTGSVPEIFCELPTIRLVTPAKVKRGQMMLWTQIQYDSKRGTTSINSCYSSRRSLKEWAPFVGHMTSRQFLKDSLSTIRPEHFVNILVGYTDGVVKGTGVNGYSAGLSGAQESIILGGSTRARQVITVPAWIGPRQINEVISFWGRYSNTSSGELICRIRAAGSDPMGAQDDGTIIDEARISASKFPYNPDIKCPGDTPRPMPNVHHAVKSGPLTPGQVIYVEMTATGNARFIGNRMVRWLDYPPVGLKDPDWAMIGMGGQRDTGSGWQTLQVTPAMIKQDLPLWCKF